MKSTQVEVITEAEANRADLRRSAERIASAIEIIKGHESAFEESTLEHRLIIGREIATAQQLFGLSVSEKMEVAREGKALLSRRDNSPAPAPNFLGFSSWLTTEIPDLKRTTAIKYATAFRGTGIRLGEATDAKIRSKIKDLRHQASKAGLPMPSLGMLYKQGKPSKEKIQYLPPAPPSLEDLAGEARVRFHEWMGEWDLMVKVGHLEPLGKADLAPIEQFLTTCRDQIRNRIKTANR